MYQTACERGVTPAVASAVLFAAGLFAAGPATSPAVAGSAAGDPASRFALLGGYVTDDDPDTGPGAAAAQDLEPEYIALDKTNPFRTYVPARRNDRAGNREASP